MSKAVDTTDDLAKPEKKRLAENEQVIERGLATFIEVGEALADIRDNRLYRATHASFEAYCKERWGMARRTAYQLVDAFKVTENVRHGAHPPPENERQARPLTTLETPEEQAEAWEEAVQESGGRPTAQDVTRSVDKRKNNHRAMGTGVNEWYTPQQYLELARKTLGVIDLDPASSDTAQETVQAEYYMTPDEDGLAEEWWGRVWLNPPYSQPLIEHFADKMASEFGSGNVAEAIMLTHNYTDTKWFHRASSVCSAICFTSGRIAFERSDGEIAAPTQGQAFFYYGKKIKTFAKVFKDTGLIVVPQR